MPRNVTFYLFPNFQLLDLTGPLAAFQMASLAAGTQGYRFEYLSLSGGPVKSSVGITVATETASVTPSDSFVVVGGFGVGEELKRDTALPLVRWAAEGALRVGSVCTGAFLLAAAGLLDGRKATTHWSASSEFRQKFPLVKLEADRIYVEDGKFWTSAGVTAGIDLALAWVERDYGAEVSRTVARELVVYHRRPGGQSQFSELSSLDPDSDRLRRVVTWARDRLEDRLTVETLASVACLSPRQFARKFLAETGETPAKFVERLRAEAARLMVTEGDEPVESVARTVGFRDPERMRRAFLRCFGMPPQALRRAARSGS